MDSRKTLFEIVVEVLEKYNDANLVSEEANKRIADDVCNAYYDEIYYDEIESKIIEHEDFDLGNIK